MTALDCWAATGMAGAASASAIPSAKKKSFTLNSLIMKATRRAACDSIRV